MVMVETESLVRLTSEAIKNSMDSDDDEDESLRSHSAKTRARDSYMVTPVNFVTCITVCCDRSSVV